MLHRYLDVSATLPEALGQHGDHVFVVVQQLLHQFTETSLRFLILDLSKHTNVSTNTETLSSLFFINSVTTLLTTPIHAQ